MFVVTYIGKFAFIKPWTAVRDGETFSQQFLSPSTLEGIEKKLFPEQLNVNGTQKILRYKLSYSGMDAQQEVTQTRGWTKTTKPRKGFQRERSVLVRNVLLNPILCLAFSNIDDAKRAVEQHVCLCRNEDIMLPNAEIIEMNDNDFNQLPGYELISCDKSEDYGAFLVGFNRFHDNKPMYGKLEFNGVSVI